MLLKSFFNYLEFERRYSPHTLTSYRNDLNQFFNFLKEEYEIDDPKKVKHAYVRSFLVQLMEAGNSSKTINRKISALRSLFKFAIKKGDMKSNPMDKIIAPKVPKRLPSFIEEKNIEELFNEIDFGEGNKAIMDRLMIEILYATGIRRAELINLKRGDVDLNNSTIKVLGKGNKERIVPVHPKLISSLNEYLDGDYVEAGSSSYLFHTGSGKKLYPKYVYRTVTKYLKLVSTNSKRSPHVLRHTFATLLSNSGADINALKELLGHASLAATQIYTHNTIEKLKDVHKQAHPKS